MDSTCAWTNQVREFDVHVQHMGCASVCVCNRTGESMYAHVQYVYVNYNTKRSTVNSSTFSLCVFAILSTSFPLFPFVCFVLLVLFVLLWWSIWQLTQKMGNDAWHWMIGRWSSKTFLREKLLTSKRNLNDVVTLMFLFLFQTCKHTHDRAYASQMYSNIQKLTECNHLKIIATVVQNKFITFCETWKFGHPKWCMHGVLHWSNVQFHLHSRSMFICISCTFTYKYWRKIPRQMVTFCVVSLPFSNWIC